MYSVDVKPVSSSFRDPDSRVVVSARGLERHIMPSYYPHYQRLMASGLYAHLTHKDLLVEHSEDCTHDMIVLRPEVVPFISYPYEWSFSQLQKAAAVTLEIALIALDYGMMLKDASAYNIQCVNGKWKLIDTASFENYTDGQPWGAFGQFVRHFLLPLAMCHYRSADYLKLLMSHVDGLPVWSMAGDLPLRSFLNWKYVAYLHLFRMTKSNSKQIVVKKQHLVNVLHSLQGMVGKFTYKLRSEWSDYDPDSEYTAAKLQMVTELLTIPRCRVGDLGANTGRYTMTAERLGHDVIAIDRDHDCIEWLARQQLRSLPLVVDFCNPSPGIGWGNEEREAFLDRAEFDVTLALALVHHLCIGNNVPVDMVAEQLRRITKRTLLIEFVPETDPKAQILAQGRTFPEYSRDAFERAMSRHFVFEDRWQIGNSCRDLYMYHAG